MIITLDPNDCLPIAKVEIDGGDLYNGDDERDQGREVPGEVLYEE